MTYRIVGAALVSVAAVLLVATGAALASGTLDQEQTSIITAYGVNDANPPLPTSRAQTFTAGLTGGLTEVDLALCTGSNVVAPLDVEITTVSGGAPTSTVLASAVVPAASVTATCAFSEGAFVPIDFSSPAPVTDGTQYAIVAYTADPYGYGWGGTYDGGYTAGSAWITDSSPPTSWSLFTPPQMAFKTYVSTPAATRLIAAPQLVLFEPFVGVGNQVVQATLTSGGNPLAGQTISFSDGSTPLCSAPTNSKGIARCTISGFDQLLLNRNNHYTATFDGTAGYIGSSSTVPATTFFW